MAASGIGTRLLQRAAATLTGATCGAYGAFATVSGGTNPTSPFTDTVATGSCYKYQYVVSDNVGNSHTASSANVVKVSSNYFDTVFNTSGLLNYYRLGESQPTDTVISSDSMTGTAATLLTSHTGEIGATWNYQAGTGNNERISTQNRAHRNGSGYSINYTSATPPSATYSVSADLFVKTFDTDDAGGVVGRLTPGATPTYYLARWETDNTWNIVKMSGTTPNWLNTSAAQPNLTVGSTYNVRLEMSGTTTTTLNLYVNGALMISATDTTAPLTAAGKAGIMDGDVGGTFSKGDATGVHFDNFLASVPATYPAVTDAKGTNHGTYSGGVTLGQTGALNEANTAALFDGVDDYASVPRQISGNMSIEFWFKSTQGLGTTGQWPQYAGLVDANVTGTNNDFGISLSADGHLKAGVGNPDTTITSAAGGYDNGAWHHVVFTRSTSGAFSLYVDGGAAVSGTGNTAALTASANLNFGRIAAGTNYYLGHIDEVAIYNSVLTGATVTAHYNAAP